MIFYCLQGFTNNVYIVGDERVLVRITNTWWKKHLMLYHIEIIIDEVYAINCSSKSISSGPKCGKLRYFLTSKLCVHYDDVIMRAMASQITSLAIVYSIVYSDADQRKHQSSASLAFVWGIHRGPVNSPHKWPVTRKMFPFDDVIMLNRYQVESKCGKLWSSWDTCICMVCLNENPSNLIPAFCWHEDRRTIPQMAYELLIQNTTYFWFYVWHIEAETTGRHFADYISKCIFLNENTSISINISLKFVPEGRINNIKALVQIMAWRRLGDKPLSEPMMISSDRLAVGKNVTWLGHPNDNQSKIYFHKLWLMNSWIVCEMCPRCI